MRNREELDPLARLVSSVLASARYRSVCSEVVERVGAIELEKRKTWKDAENETRKHLHRICGSNLDSVPPYAKWLETLRTVTDGDGFRSELRRMMLCHASTCERLPVLDEFYRRTLEFARPVRSIVDIGCGFNPLAMPWMNLERDCTYEGYDVYSDMTAFLEAALGQLPDESIGSVKVVAKDISVDPPGTVADVALILKFLPLLELKSGQETLDWMGQLNTRYALVSFPTRTLGGRNVGMARSHEAGFKEVLQASGWSSERIEFQNELCFMVEINCDKNRAR
jgi:16S rRNA (guanine(1405)-N(7))-methyltransferase